MNDEISTAVGCDELLLLEKQHVVSLRSSDLQKLTEPDDIYGLALSGGGIRSATFSLGVIQALAEKNLLHRIDYVSGVSGGNYIAAWLSACILEERMASKTESECDAARAISAVEKKFNPAHAPMFTDDIEPREVRFLRAFSSYLTPRLGLFSGDTLSLLAGSLRNLTLNLFLFAISALFFIAFVHELVPFAQFIGSGWCKTFARVFFGLSLGFIACCLTLQSFDRNSLPQPGKLACLKILSRPRMAVFLILAPSTLFLAIWLASPSVYKFVPVIDHLKLTMWIALLSFYGVVTGYIFAFYSTENWGWLGLLGRSFRKNIVLILLSLATFAAMSICISELFSFWPRFSGNISSINVFTVSFGPAFVLLEVWLLYLIWMMVVGRFFSDYAREWLNRLFGQLSSVVVIWALFGTICVYARPVTLWAAHALPESFLRNAQYAAGAVVGAAAFALLIYSARSTRVGNDEGRASNVAPKSQQRKFIETAGSILLILLIAAILVVVYQSFLLMYFGVDYSSALKGQPLTFADIVKLHTDGINCSLSLEPQVGCVGQPTPFSTFFPLQVLGALTFFGFLLIDVNVFSLQNLYRNRLVRCYLGASNRHRDPEPYAGFDPFDDFELERVANQRPYLLCNAALNISKGQALAWQQRKAASFLFSPLWCGYWLAPTEADINSAGETEGVEKEWRGGYVPTKNYVREAVSFQEKSRGIMIGTAMATSGAAVSSQMGYASREPRAFFMTLLNLRLGRWLPNPRFPSQRLWEKQSPLFSLPCYLSELFGMTTERSKWIYVSDGGHFENLGLYELIRRRCRRVICVDGGADPMRTFADLGNALQKCRVDFGVEIIIDTGPLTSDSEGKSSTGFVRGTIHYPYLSGSPPFVGSLLYIKPSLSRELKHPTDILAYKSRHPEFPHEPTRNQWFSETQFESYRKLGYLLGLEAFEAA